MPGQNQVIANIGAYVALVEQQQLALKNRLDLIAPESGGSSVIGGPLDMKSNDITNAHNITVANLHWAKQTPSVYGLQYSGGAAGPLLANSTVATSILPATAFGSLSWPENKWSAYSSIKFRAGIAVGATGTPTLTLRLLLNGTAIATHVLSPTTNAGAEFDAELTVTSPTNATMTSRAAISGIAASLTPSAAISVDTTIVNTLTFTAQWSAASASNTVTLAFVKAEYMQS